MRGCLLYHLAMTIFASFGEIVTSRLWIVLLFPADNIYHSQQLDSFVHWKEMFVGTMCQHARILWIGVYCSSVHFVCLYTVLWVLQAFQEKYLKHIEYKGFISYHQYRKFFYEGRVKVWICIYDLIMVGES